MHPRSFSSFFKRRAFTLIELLVVIAIIAILSVVVILTLNPAELLRQSRDANRLSDLSTMNSALNLYSTDQSGASNFNMGSTSTIYVSIPDPSATSTTGDQCQGLGLPVLAASSGWNYHCAASSTYRNTNGTGWLPVNFSNIASGAPFGNLPVDTTNQTSSYLYYTYLTDGTKYAVTAALESQKYLKQYLLVSNPDPARYVLGSNLNLVASSEGLVMYWPLNEGAGSTAVDGSANNNNGTWIGTASGTNGYYTTNAKIGAYAGFFNGANNYITSTFSVTSGQAVTYVGWLYSTQSGFVFNNFVDSNSGNPMIWWDTTGKIQFDQGLGTTAVVYRNTWTFVALSKPSGSSGATYYVNGTSIGTGSAYTVAALSPTWFNRAGSQNWTGMADDVRVYNRALSAAEIQAIYNAEK